MSNCLSVRRQGIVRQVFLLYCLLSLLNNSVHGHYPEVMDVVTMALKPTCVNRQMVMSLNKYLVPKPRRIHIIAAINCNGFLSFAPNVVCHPEDKVVPGLTRADVRSWLADRFRARSSHDARRVEGRGNWFFQQVLKLAASEYIPGLTEHFLVYDSDMIALRPLTWFVPPDIIHSEKATGVAQSRPRPPASPIASTGGRCVNPHPFKVLVHVGGWTPKYGYMATYKNLTGRDITRGHDRASLVTHNMLVYRPFMAAFLANITTARHRGNKLGWALSVLDSVATLRDIGEVIVGFSEYWSYLSWVQQTYPCTVIQARKREWTRTPVLHPTALPIHILYKGAFVPVCCPTARNMDVTRQRGFLFTGFELGHLRHCQYHHEVFREGYAPWYVPLT